MSNKRKRSASVGGPSDGPGRGRSPGRRRMANLYDAVAGRVGYESFIDQEQIRRAVYPEEVLFRRINAPDRYEENDAYFAHEKLDPKLDRLPDSDLLKAIHYYTSKFYSKAVPNRGKRDYRSMDETALLVMGILLEEAVAHKLGENGDLAFVEAQSADQGVMMGPGIWDGRRYRRSVMEVEPSPLPQRQQSAPPSIPDSEPSEASRSSARKREDSTSSMDLDE